MDNQIFCRVCLVTDVKMHSMTKPPLLEAYLQILQITAIEKQEQYVCFECACLLQKYQNFSSKCVQAHDILNSLHLDNLEVTKEIIKHVDRKQTKLLSKLCISPITTFNSPLESDLDEDEKVYISEIKEECDIEVLDSTGNKEHNEAKNLCPLTFSEDTDDLSDDCLDDLDNDALDENYESNENSSESESSDTDGILINLKKRISQMNTRKEPKSKKKKVKTQEIKDEFDSDLDDEPLATKIVKRKPRKVVRKNGEKIDRRVTFNVKDFEEFATVVILTPEDARKEVLLRKESRNYKYCPYKCDLCFRGFEVKTAYDNHMKKHSVDNGPHECEYCYLRFSKQRFLCKHRLSCHKRKFYCKICPYICFCTYQAKTHMSLHKGKRYPCEVCGELFSMPNSLLMHKRLKHKFMMECVCPLCGSTFGKKRGLLAHNVLVHRQEKNELLGPNCEECGVKFATEQAWKRHLVLSSKHIVFNGCEYCGETFPDEMTLKIHTKVHTRKQWTRNDPRIPVACSICNKWLTDRNVYKDHMTKDHPDSEEAKSIEEKRLKMCVCEVCGKMFKKQCFLIYHQRKHTGERPYKCQECGKTYVFPGALSTHKATHKKQTKFHKCDMCDKMFRSRSSLNKHVKAHLGIRPHKCAICDKSFPNPCDVKVHMKYVHYKVPWPKRDRSKRTNVDGKTT